MAKTLSPPKDFPTWLDYAVATMDARGAYLERMFDDAEIPAQDEIRATAQDELDRLRQKSVMPWVRILENWKTKLSQRLGRSEEVILEDSLLATDFSENGVRIQFEDGTDLNFRRAFFLGNTPSDGSIHRVAVFTEHCGYHEFWIGPDDRIEEVVPLKAQRNETERVPVMGNPSDSVRIDETIGALKRAWQQNPQLRLGQLLVWATQAKEPCSEIFYAEDGKLLRNIRAIDKGIDLKALTNKGSV